MSQTATKRVAIFTNFGDYQQAYSLTRVVRDQIKMLVTHGYKPTVIVNESFEPQDMYAHPDVTIFRLPNIPVSNDIEKDPTFEADVNAIAKGLERLAPDVDVIITHDVVYQPACLKHNFAARRVAAKFPQIKWLHWIHSATPPVTFGRLVGIFGDDYVNLVRKPFPNSKYVYFNDFSVPSVASNFDISQEEVRVVHHPTDIVGFLGISPQVEELVEKKHLLEADAICIYPIRLDRGKQVQMVIRTMAMLKKLGTSVRVVIVDFHSTGGDKVTYRDDLKQIGIDYGLNSDELTFTSEFNKEWRNELPYAHVRDLMLLSNVFIMPSVSESYSLITQEAGILKNVVVLNYDFPPFRDIFGSNAIFRKYSSNFDVMADPTEAMTSETSRTTTEYGPNGAPADARRKYEEDYHSDTAKMISARLNHPEMKLSTFLRKHRNLDYIFKRELEPLFWE